MNLRYFHCVFKEDNVRENKNRLRSGIILLLSIVFVGCHGAAQKEAVWHFRSTTMEAEWIRNGEPMEFEDEKWYPADAIENLLDNEVYLVGQYREAALYVEMTDVRPYERLYTRFSRNKYRFFEKRLNN